MRCGRGSGHSLYKKIKMTQTDLFNLLKKKVKKKRRQVEDKFRNSIQDFLKLIKVPFVHINYYCGNKFYHRCPHCHKFSVVSCNKINNLANAGHFDILGIAWAIETKTFKRKTVVQDNQKLRQQDYLNAGIPSLICHDRQTRTILDFIGKIYPGRFK